jgi:hypothetical protein
MKQGIHLSIDKTVYNYLRRNRVNISKYVERLVLQDLAANQTQQVAQSNKRDGGSNPPGAIHFSDFSDTAVQNTTFLMVHT